MMTIPDRTISDGEAEVSDGRLARSQRTRAAVAEGMLDCLERGNLRPSARQVAEQAGVSTRAVFRHFENMEALLEQAAKLQIERVVAQLPEIATEGSLEARIDSLVAYATKRNEVIEPVRRAALLIEPFSPVIKEKHAWMRQQTRRQIRAALAPELAALPDDDRADRTQAIRALLSFAYWDELRRHSRLSNAATHRVIAGTIAALVDPGRQV